MTWEELFKLKANLKWITLLFYLCSLLKNISFIFYIFVIMACGKKKENVNKIFFLEYNLPLPCLKTYFSFTVRKIFK